MDRPKLTPPSDSERNTFGNLFTAVVCFALSILAGWSFYASLAIAIVSFVIAALLWKEPRGLVPRLRRRRRHRG